MVTLADGKMIDSDRIEAILVEQMTVGQPYRQGHVSGVMTVPMAGPESFRVVMHLRTPEKKVPVRASLTQEAAMKLKKLLQDGVESSTSVVLRDLIAEVVAGSK